MTPQETLDVVTKRYKLDLTQPSPIRAEIGRNEIGVMLNDMGFKKAVELGVYKGKYTQVLATTAPNMMIFAVDAWTSYSGYEDYAEGDLETVGFPQAQSRCFRLPNVQMIKAWSKDAVLTFPDASLDYLYIDANHTYEECKKDIALWAPKVKPGGIVMGHDYFETSGHRRLAHLNFGVVRAVNEYTQAGRIKHLFVTTDTYPSWFYVQGDVE